MAVRYAAVVANERTARSLKQNPRRPTHQDSELGSRLKSRRIAAGLTQQDLANAFRVSYQQVQKYEKGTSRMSGGRLREAASLLGLSIQDLLGEPASGAAAGFAEAGGAAYVPAGADVSELVRHYQAIKSKADRAMVVRMAKLLAS